MKKKTVTAESVVLHPVTEDALGIGLSVDPDGQLRAALTITTDGWGDFLIPLTAAQLGMLAVTARKFLTLTEEQAEALRISLQAANQQNRKRNQDD